MPLLKKNLHVSLFQILSVAKFHTSEVYTTVLHHNEISILKSWALTMCSLPSDESPDHCFLNPSSSRRTSPVSSNNSPSWLNHWNNYDDPFHLLPSRFSHDWSTVQLTVNRHITRNFVSFHFHRFLVRKSFIVLNYTN